MIELYKIFMGKYDFDITLKSIGKCIQRQYDTRNHRFALKQSHLQCDMSNSWAWSQHYIVYKHIKRKKLTNNEKNCTQPQN